jgi:hypothetical protein
VEVGRKISALRIWQITQQQVLKNTRQIIEPSFFDVNIDLIGAVSAD